jgi:6-phosphofructokinase 2
MVAGLLAGLMRGDSLVEAAALGTAAGAAAILTPNTELCRIEDVNRLRPEVTITAVEVAPAPVA